MGKVKSTLVICLTALPLLINAPAAQAEEGFNLERQLRQLMQLDSKTVRKIRPLISRYQRCLGKQQALLEQDLSIKNIVQAQRACKPVMNKLLAQLGLTTEKQKAEAAAKLYKQLLKSSI